MPLSECMLLCVCGRVCCLSLAVTIFCLRPCSPACDAYCGAVVQCSAQPSNGPFFLLAEAVPIALLALLHPAFLLLYALAVWSVCAPCFHPMQILQPPYCAMTSLLFFLHLTWSALALMAKLRASINPGVPGLSLFGATLSTLVWGPIWNDFGPKHNVNCFPSKCFC